VRQDGPARRGKIGLAAGSITWLAPSSSAQGAADGVGFDHDDVAAALDGRAHHRRQAHRAAARISRDELGGSSMSAAPDPVRRSPAAPPTVNGSIARQLAGHRRALALWGLG